MRTLSDNGVVSLRSARSVSDTMVALEDAVKAAGLQIVPKVDHSSAAERVGMRMPPTQLLIFGNASSGTPLMMAAPTVAIDLPLKALIWQDKEGVVWLSYNSPLYLAKRHQIPDYLLKHIEGIKELCEQVANASSSSERGAS